MTTESNQLNNYVQLPPDLLIPLPIWDYTKKRRKAKYRVKMVYWKRGDDKPYLKIMESVIAQGLLGEMNSIRTCEEPPTVVITRKIIVGVEKID